MADISITVTADPAQALQGLEAVKKKADELAESQRKVQEASDAAATDSMNSISTVSREAMQTIAKTGDALSEISTSISMAGKEASLVAGAFGKSIPVIGQVGSAISKAITGPVGLISAALGAAIFAINLAIKKAEDRIALLRMKTEGKSTAAYDALMQGRQDYADQLAVLAQVREINRYAQENKLTTDQLAQFRQLASQIGIAERDVGDRGIRSGKLSDAIRSMKHYRDFYAEQEYTDYLNAMQKQTSDAIKQSKLSDADKRRLAQMSILSRADYITQAAQRGYGNSIEEYQAWQDLYGIIRPVNDVRASYNRDKLLGRDQSALNSIIADDFKAAAEKAAKGSSSGGGSAGKPLWQIQDEAAQAELDAEKQRKERVDKLIAGMDRQIQMNELIADGKEKEAFLLKNRLQAEDLNGKALTEAQIAEIDARSERLYALQHPEEPDLAPEDPGTPARAARAQQGYTARLDRLQAVGANLRNPAVSPEKMVMDKQLTVQEQIRNILQSNFTASQQVGGMIFT